MLNERAFFTRTSIFVACLILVSVLGFVDYATGYEFGFFVFYFVPVAVAAWAIGATESYLMAALSSVVWLFADRYSENPASLINAFWNTIMRFISFLITGYSISRIRVLLDEERKISGDLREALGQVKTLRGLIPICANCKKIRNDKGYWQQVEEYVERNTDAQFTHGLCEQCSEKLLKEIEGIQPEGAAPVAPPPATAGASQ